MTPHMTINVRRLTIRWCLTRRLCRLVFCVGLGVAANSPSATYYVASNGLDTADGLNWITAVRTISNGIAKATAAGDVVLVSNGVYVLATNLYIPRAITVRGVNGAAATVVDGANTNRCLWMTHTNAVFDGFTITRGSNASPGGGGVLFQYGGTLQNCIVVSNTTSANGGGIYAAASGSQIGVISNCTIAQNSAVANGGIYMVSGGLLINSRVVSNTASVSCGGVGITLDGLVMNSVIGYNLATNSGLGGGVWLNQGGTLRNCLIVSNGANKGGGVYFVYGSGVVQNCTIVNNWATNAAGGGEGGGGGVYYQTGAGSTGTVVNSIVYNNWAPGTAGSNWSVQYKGRMSYSCTAPTNMLMTGFAPEGNIENDPLFVQPATGDFRLRKGSPSINTGANQDWMAGSSDLDGHHRLDVFSGLVDMGCFENIPSGTMITIP